MHTFRPPSFLRSIRALAVDIPRTSRLLTLPTTTYIINTPGTPRLALWTASTLLHHYLTKPAARTINTKANNTLRIKAAGNMSAPANSEKEIKRNPHPDFKGVEASRPDWDTGRRFGYTKTPDPNWTWGDGANHLHGDSAQQQKQHEHVAIDPYEAGRPSPFNYKLLISAIVPRPIGFVSTRGSAAPEAGTGAAEPQLNLAPFSYFNLMCHDPPMFALGVAAGAGKQKDTLRHLLETRECVVNIIGEDFIEAANATSVDAPVGASEWDLSGLTPAFDCATVKAPRVREAVFSVECRLDSARELQSRNPATPGRHSGSLVILEGVRFWVRGDALNDDKNLVDPAVLRPMSRLGGITYARVTDAIELPRPTFAGDVGGQEGYERVRQKVQEKRKAEVGQSEGSASGA